MPSATSAKAIPAELRRHGAGENARADQEQALLSEQPQPVEELLVGIRRRPARPRSRCDISSRRGIAPKKRGSTRPSISRGCCASMSPSRGAAPTIEAISETRSGFCCSNAEQRRRRAARPAGSCRTGSAHRPGSRHAPGWLSSIGNRPSSASRVAFGAQCAVFAGEPALERFGDCRRLLEAERDDVAPATADRRRRGESRAQARTASSARPRTACCSAAARSADGRAALRRMRRDRQSRESAQTARTASASSGSVCVCSSATICSRCSTLRRNS